LSAGSFEKYLRTKYTFHLVEGGAKLLNSFIELGLWDEAHVEVSEQVIHEGVSAPTLNSQPDEIKEYDQHLWITYKIIKTFRPKYGSFLTIVLSYFMFTP